MNLSWEILDRFQDSFHLLSIAEIERAEALLGGRLARDYVEFLLKYNGGYFRHTVGCPILEPSQFLPEVWPKQLYAILSEGEATYGDLVEQAKVFRDRIPGEVSPIGNTGNNILCLGISGTSQDRVFVWDHEEAELRVQLVANSFTDFLERLKPILGADLEVESIPIFRHVERGEWADVHAHIQQGSDIEVLNEQGRTLLSSAVRYRWPRIAQLLLDSGANIHASDDQGLLPLHLAVRAGSCDCVRLLLNAGADPSIRDARGASLIEIAEKGRHFRVARLLRASGALPGN